MNLRPEEFFQAAHDCFLSRVASHEIYHREIGVAGLNCRIESTAEWRGLFRALDHLPVVSSAAPSLTIRAWQGAIPRVPWSAADYGQRGLIRGFNDSRFSTVFDHATNSLSMLDRENRIALFWTRTINNLPNHIRSAPLRTIFGWWLEAHGRILIHAGAVAKQNRAVLLIGPGGSGKSTAALLCLKTGWKYLADDYCVVDQSEGNDLPTVFSLYQTAKISKDWLSRLNVIESDASEPVDNKQLIFVDEIFPDQMECSARCCAGLLPIVSKEMRTGIVPATNGEAVRALAPTSMFQNAMAAEPAFRLIVRFVVRLPIARLQLGQNLDEIPRQIDNHLRMVP